MRHRATRHSLLPTPRLLTRLARILAPAFCLRCHPERLVPSAVEGSEGSASPLRLRHPFFRLLTSNFCLLTSLFCLLTPVLSPAQGIITTVAGNGRIIRGDGGPATSAVLGQIVGVAVDSAGNVFATDGSNNQVVKISPTGILSVVAGNGLQGYSGDGGPATSASLNFPQGIAVDLFGNLYIVDRNNIRVRKVSPDGIITTVVGNGVSRFSGDGGPATGASLRGPTGVVIDRSGNLYVADINDHRIRRVSPAGIIVTVAGNGVGGFSGDGGPATNASLFQPREVAVDGSGNLYIADQLNHRIRKVSADGIISTLAGNGVEGFAGDGGPATSASLSQPSGVAVDAGGNLYIADTFNLRIRKVSADGIISTVAGGSFGFSGDGGPATSASLKYPLSVAADANGELYIADTSNGRIRRVRSEGMISTMAGVGLLNFSGDGGPASSALLSQPLGVTIDAAGNIYIADQFNHRIRKVSPTGIISSVAGAGVAGFSGDGGPAVSALVNTPQGVAVDAAGNVYIADGVNARVRKISFVGVITTVAGNGNYDFSGDGGPAMNASFRIPSRLALDPTGNLFIADRNNNRIRKVSPDGIITTFAGTGVGGFSGDGGPATEARLNSPIGLALDTGGNLYIADFGNNRIRKVSSGGVITTVAGGGGVSGDGGPATSASLSDPVDVAVDGAGNLYIADTSFHRIRKVDSNGIITNFAGRGTEGFSGDGGPATNALLDFPQGVAVDGAGNVYIADTNNDRIRKVLAAPPSFSVSPTTLDFTAAAGAQISAPQRITVTSPVTGLAWSAQASTESGGSWLAVSPGSGSAPVTMDIFVNAASLGAGTYRGTITVQAPLANPAVQTVAVTLRVDAALPPQLAVEPSAIAFEGTVGASNLPSQTVRIRNAGGSLLNWTARAATSSGGNWLTIAPASGSASADSPGLVQVSANGTGLAAGVYSGSVRVESAATGQTQTVAVTLLLSPPTSTILVSQSGLLFTGVEGGTAAPPQTFAIVNTGRGTINWTAEASTLSGGNWLSVSPASGASVAGSLDIPLVEVGVSVAGLRAGAYGGLIRVNAAGAGNSPQFVTITLNVLPPGSNPGVIVRPTGLIFAALAGTSSPGSQTIRLGTASPGSVEARSGLLTFDGGDWLVAAPRNAVLSATAAPQRITVQPTVGSLAPGVYRGALTLLFSDGSLAQVVNILFLVVGGGAGGAGGRILKSGEAEAGLSFEPALDCAPQQLYAVNRSLGTNFASPVGWPSLIEVQVVDDCGNAVSNASVLASFSNGDPPLVLASLGNGIYVGTWRPEHSAGQVVVTLRASLPPLQPAAVQAQGQASNNPTAAALYVGGIVNAASFAVGEAVAPGAMVSVFGRNLARGENHASRVPLETSLGGASLNVGGMDAPLFYSADGQINAQLPFDLAPNSRPAVVVRTTRTDGTQQFTVPETITLATARPGIFTRNDQGTGQGKILNQDYAENSPANPAPRGSVIQVYATGLGATNPPVPSGNPGPRTAAEVTQTVTATIDGSSAPVQFAGLAPDFVGLYQVNVVVPANVRPGPEVPLVLIQNGVPSNTVTVAIR